MGAQVIQFPTAKVRRTPQELAEDRVFRFLEHMAEGLGESPELLAETKRRMLLPENESKFKEMAEILDPARHRFPKAR